jgi:putative aldouronate transport system permease protein
MAKELTVKPAAIHETFTDNLFNIVVNTLLVAGTILVVYPLLFVIFASVSDPAAIQTGKVLLWPVKPELTAYQSILQDSRIWTGYRNTLLYTGGGTLLGVILTILGGYALSRKDLIGSALIMKIMVFTMYFNGGLIPTYMVVKNLGLINTPYVLMILGSFTVFNLIITRTFFMSKIPDELLEAARIDGCGDGRFFWNIALPISKEIVAVITLFYAVSHWNSFFNALIYVNKPHLYPLQIILREILVGAENIMMEDVDMAAQAEMLRLQETVKYAVIIVGSLPVLAAYLFIQRFFIRGIMIGSIKG